MLSPSAPLGWSSHTVQPEGTVPSHRLKSWLLGGRGGPAPLLTAPLLVDSQRHRVTEEEAQQNRFRMPPLEEGEWGRGGAHGDSDNSSPRQMPVGTPVPPSSRSFLILKVPLGS